MARHKPTVEIQNWILVAIDRDTEILVGDAINHPYLGSGNVHTSAVVHKDIEAGTVETRNTRYKLVGPQFTLYHTKASAESARVA
jgi:hypothetical protein